MPTYDYECESCGHRFEVFQSMSDDPIKRCPECGKKVRRLIGGGLGVIFKGSGFYVTDNRRSTNGSSKKNGDGKSEAAAKSGDSSKSDSGAKSSTDSKKGSESSSSGSSSKGSGTAVKD